MTITTPKRLVNELFCSFRRWSTTLVIWLGSENLKLNKSYPTKKTGITNLIGWATGPRCTLGLNYTSSFVGNAAMYHLRDIIYMKITLIIVNINWLEYCSSIPDFPICNTGEHLPGHQLHCSVPFEKLKIYQFRLKYMHIGNGLIPR